MDAVRPGGDRQAHRGRDQLRAGPMAGDAMTGAEQTAIRLARAALTCVADPADPVLAALLRSHTPVEIVAALTAGRMPGGPGGRAGSGERSRPHADEPSRVPGLDRAWPRWA